LSGALSAITAAVVGVILNLAIWFAIHTMFQEVRAIGLFGWSVELPLIASLDAWAVALASAALIAVFRYDVGILPLLAVAVAAGLCLHLVGALP
jgi:chromate transporter